MSIKEINLKLLLFLNENGIAGATIWLLERKVKSNQATPEEFLFLADAYLRKKRANDHINTLMLAISKYPKNRTLNLYLGWRFLELKKIKQALLCFLLIRNKKNKKLPNYKANESALIAQCHILLGKWEQAKKELNFAEKINPWDLDVLKGWCLYFQYTNQPDKFKEKIQQYIKLCYHCFPPYAWMADYIHYYKNQPAEALAWYQKAYLWSGKIINHNFYDFYYSTFGLREDIISGYIKALLAANNKKGAEKVLSELPKKGYLSDDDIRMFKIDFCIQTKDYAGAENLLKNILKRRKPTSVEYTQFADLKLAQKLFGEAEKYARLAVSQNSASVNLTELLGKIKMGKRKWGEAAKIFEGILDNIPISPENLECLGQCYMHLKQWEKAKKVITKLKRLSPYNKIALRNLEKLSLSMINERQ